MAGDPHVHPPSLQFPDLPKMELDDLIDQLVERAQGVKHVQGRLRALLRAIETVTGDLALETVLRNVVEAACELTHARYGALGVISHDRSLEQFIYVGVDAETAARIGDLPRGKGLLGALITDPHPIRLQHMIDDSRSVGFPPNHPPMDSFIGVPIHVRGDIYGNLYLAESEAGEFSAEDEALLVALGLAAGTAISHARLYQESGLKQRWLEASVEISAQMLAASGEDPLHLIARRARSIAGADAVTVSLLSADRASLIVEVAFGGGAEDLIGRRFSATETLGGRVVETGVAVLGDTSEDVGPPSDLSLVANAGPLMVVPLMGAEKASGVLSLARVVGRRAFGPADLAMAAGFAAHASVALELAVARVAEQKVVLLEDRDRIAMDLHDHVIQELFGVGLRLEGAAGRTDEPLATRLRQCVEDIDRTIRRIRSSIFELRGSFLTTEGGVRQRVLEVAGELTAALGFAPHTGFAGLVDIALDEELTGDVVACVRETLTNIAKHAGATSASVDVAIVGGELTVTVSDNGVGFGNPTHYGGLGNLRARAQKRHGSFELEPGPRGGTVVRWRVSIR
ncbi:MAG: hypothetical protein QOI15_353 [Pseudonocardiales bacterium]|jgi:signal transduction histidine kinase|nr:hypothetical protein [Pseudonocardiales bacterium]